MKRVGVLAFVMVFCFAFVSGSAQALSIRSSAQVPAGVGNDVSWPNCRKANDANGQWGIVGVTGGKVFTTNPCLANEASWFPNSTLAVYVNTANWGLPRAAAFTTFPKRCKANDAQCIAYNFGYVAGRYAVLQASRAGVHAGTWWLDVETVNSWTNDLLANRASLQGTADATRHYALFANVGFYSTQYQWDLITGGWQPNDPAWLATGSNSAATAAAYCKQRSFTAKPILLTQYTQTLDLDKSC